MKSNNPDLPGTTFTDYYNRYIEPDPIDESILEVNNRKFEILKA